MVMLRTAGLLRKLTRLEERANTGNDQARAVLKCITVGLVPRTIWRWAGHERLRTVSGTRMNAVRICGERE